MAEASANFVACRAISKRGSGWTGAGGQWRCAFMTMQDSVIEGKAREVIARLADGPAGESVRAMVGRPSRRLIARRVQATVLASGITGEVHDDLLWSL